MKDKQLTTLQEELQVLPSYSDPVKKLNQEGIKNLSNRELIAVLLDKRNGDRVSRADQLLNNADGLRSLTQAVFLEDRGRYDARQAETYLPLPKLTPLELARLEATIELACRVNSATSQKRTLIQSPEDVAKLVMNEMKFLDKEVFRAIALNTKNHVLDITDISVGSLNATIVHPRELFKVLIRKSAAAVVVVHNHPSGDPSPSKEDREMTRRLVDSGKLLGIEVLDHIVIGDNKYSSLKELGYI
ncbi:DNA repair protein RadC [Heliorestis acidaminivorans]|uniref:DNA repair protein RadC n=2 Tax=Heliorestis TaxID=79598 RepID=A0A6I0F1V6_9FIRM|nr:MULTISPECIES: DNA repair protein RadC [Heliorestis]KAB2952149.1 DNA repair protein RadC [Heliorestis acidaminivorans]QGG46843.1 DNA repair protein RadC [Heliorestis convoluta]